MAYIWRNMHTYTYVARPQQLVLPVLFPAEAVLIKHLQMPSYKLRRNASNSW